MLVKDGKRCFPLVLPIEASNRLQTTFCMMTLEAGNRLVQTSQSLSCECVCACLFKWMVQ